MTIRIDVRGVSLDVPMYVQPERAVRGWSGLLLGAAFDAPRRRFARILSDISFEANEGDRIAILGRNGAGKSTLLRVLNGVYTPTAGSVHVTGSCQALLNISLGFNGEATVRENIFLRGTAMGLRADDLREQIDPILEFSGLHDKTNHRLRTLSAGQKMRLGFAISTSFQHDVILMDEWVGAGDAQFMEKATERMQDRVGGSKVVMLASHSVGLLRNICNRGIVLEQGRLVYQGDIVSSLTHYHELLAQLRIRAEPGAVPEDGSAQVYGCAEAIARLPDGSFRIKGWLVDTEGRVPGGVVLQVMGRRYVARDVEHHPRADVAGHFGLANAECGFHADVHVPGAESLADLGEDIQVFGGSSPEEAHAPLRIAPGFVTPRQST